MNVVWKLPSVTVKSGSLRQPPGHRQDEVAAAVTQILCSEAVGALRPPPSYISGTESRPQSCPFQHPLRGRAQEGPAPLADHSISNTVLDHMPAESSDRDPRPPCPLRWTSQPPRSAVPSPLPRALSRGVLPPPLSLASRCIKDMTSFPSLHPCHSPSTSVFKRGRKQFDCEALPGLSRFAKCWVFCLLFSPYPRRSPGNVNISS